MTEGKLLPCESESPGFLMVPSNCSLIRGPLMSCFPTHLLAKPCLRGIFKLSPLKTISSPPLAEGVEYILFGKQFFVPNLNPSCCVSSESVFGIPRLLLPIWKRGKKITVKPQGADSFVLEHPKRSFQTSILHQDSHHIPHFRRPAFMGAPVLPGNFPTKRFRHVLFYPGLVMTPSQSNCSLS